MADFFPADYEVPNKTTGYMKFKKGPNTFRILTSPIVGWEYWIEDKEGKRKPVRTRMTEDRPDESRHFWAMVVYNYSEDVKNVQILQITQMSVQRGIKALVDSPKWGKPFDYDITVTRQGEDLKTEYTVMPEPKEPVSKEVQDAFIATKIDLEALYEGTNPFEIKNETL